MKSYLLFGIQGDDLYAARSRIEDALGIKMTLHESSYRGGEYFRMGDIGAEHFILQKNFDESEGEWTEPRCKDCGVLLYANETDRSAALSSALAPTARLVSHQDV
jgi:hypothetical protein